MPIVTNKQERLRPSQGGKFFPSILPPLNTLKAINAKAGYGQGLGEPHTVVDDRPKQPKWGEAPTPPGFPMSRAAQRVLEEMRAGQAPQVTDVIPIPEVVEPACTTFESLGAAPASPAAGETQVVVKPPKKTAAPKMSAARAKAKFA